MKTYSTSFKLIPCRNFKMIRLYFYGVLIFSSTYYLSVFLFNTVSRSTVFHFQTELLQNRKEYPPCFDERSQNLSEVKYNHSVIYARYVSEDLLLTPKLWELVQPAMTTSEKLTVRFVLELFAEVCKAHKFTYFMFSGTLLGSFRHHGMMPWDDDIDLLMRTEERDAIFGAFRQRSNQTGDIGVEPANSRRMKLFHRNQSIAVKGWKYRWPTIDVSFYYENATHIWEGYGKKDYHIMSKSIIFPLHLRPFETLMLESPRDAFAVLTKEYKDPNCVSLSYVHRKEHKSRSIKRFSCEVVRSIYPFVHRRVVGSCVEETLILNGKVLHSVLMNEPTYAITLPYVLELEERVGATGNGTVKISNATIEGLNATARNPNKTLAKSNKTEKSRSNAGETDKASNRTVAADVKNVATSNKSKDVKKSKRLKEDKKKKN